MNLTAQAYEELIARFISWAQAEENIRTAFVIGSRARVDHPADQWSDLDIIVIANDPQPYLAATDWVENMGNPWLTFLEPTADGRSMERRVLFEGGLDVDFALFQMTSFQQMVKAQIAPDVADVFRRGMRVLLDKDGLIERLQATLPENPRPPPPPTQSVFLNLINDFWYHAVWVAKHLRRGELWWAKSGCENHLKGLLRQMMEWHTRATRGPNHDTWMRGRLLEEWADPRAVSELREAFAHYDEDDVWRALFATTDLFRWLAVETAQRWKYPCPTLGDQHATELVQKLYDGRPSSTQDVS
jgi:aminoglycoside 6-adenylyltransferase